MGALVSSPTPAEADDADKTPPQPVLEIDAAHGVTYRIMAPADVGSVTPAVVEAFLLEPTMQAGECTAKDLHAFVAMFVPRMAAEGHTVLACDTATGTVLGAFLNEDYCNPDPPGMEAFLEHTDGDWVPTVTMLGELEAKFNADWGVPAERPSGKWFHLWMLGVTPAGRGRGIGKKLATHSVALAKSNGFVCAFAECTGALSTHILTKYTGATVDMFIDYATWSGCETAPILRQLPAEGHQGMSLTVCRFT